MFTSVKQIVRTSSVIAILTIAGLAVGGAGVKMMGQNAMGQNVMAQSGISGIVGMVTTAISNMSGPNIVETAVAAGQFKTLVKAVQAAELVDTLSGAGPFTVLAPTDDAFAKFDQHALKDLLKSENKAGLQGVLTYHVLAGKMSAAELLKGGNFKTVNGQIIKVALKDGRLNANGSGIIKTDIETSNGIIHVIDKVLVPSRNTIAQTASQAGSFKTLIAAAKAAGLVDALKADGALTVFAPTDEAFAKLPAGTVDRLLKPENKDLLASILKYHIVQGRVYAADAIATPAATTLQGEQIKLSFEDGSLQVNQSRIIKTDLDNTNGVIHVIDRVLLPKAVAEQLMSAGSSPKSAAGLVTLAIERGVPLFNDGQQGACAAIYEICASSLVLMPEAAVPAEAREALKAALNKAAQADSATDKAWALRKGLDAAIASLARIGDSDDDKAMMKTFRDTANKMNEQAAKADR